ncbi:MAG: DNA-directed RNA polymerase subunit alpha [Dehalococcoidia bacterium]|nr:DNA-directed RNA polymerase subunit alpha [Dehalococcoidia bacterium]
MTDFQRPTIEVVESDDTYARIVAEPLEPGFGVTIGNGLRRVLLSSLQGAAVTSVRIDQAQHEFSTIEHVKEDTMELLLNVKEIRLRALSDRPAKMYLDFTGDGEVTAGDIEVPADYDVINQDLHLATLTSGEGRLTMEFNVDRGRGYQPATSTDGLPLGVIPVDAVFTPVRKVNYQVSKTRVGQITDYDRLTLEIWTDGTISGVEALSQSSDVLMNQFAIFSQLGRPQLPSMDRGLGSGSMLPPDIYNMPIENLNLSVRAYNSLKRTGIMTVGALLERSEDELLGIRNFGRKSYDEVKEKLLEMGLVEEGEIGAQSYSFEPGDDEDEEMPESPAAGPARDEEEAGEGLASQLPPDLRRKLRSMMAAESGGEESR